MQAIQINRLVKRYGQLTAVDGLDLQIHRGELFSLLGVNGAGKTTAIKMLSCLTAPTQGTATVGGCSITKEPEQVKRRIGVSPQETAVAPNLSVRENLELICGIHGFSREKTREKLRALSAQLSLDAVLDRRAGKLSGGWQRRVSIAMALISEPSILFLDEPTLGLDVLARHELWALIRSLKDLGLCGLEAWHPSASSKAAAQLDQLARQCGLIVTGGSDYHGDPGSTVHMGRLPSGWERKSEDMDALLTALTPMTNTKGATSHV